MTPLAAADGTTLLSAVPAAGDRRRHPVPAHLRFFHGPMDGEMVREGETVVVADTAPTPAPDADVHYQVLCRRHHVLGQLGPTAAGPGQLALS